MERIEIQARVRKETGKGPSRRIRREGRVPGVIYSPRMTPLPISLEPVDVKRVMSFGDNVLVNLKLVDEEDLQEYLVIVKDYQLHPTKDLLWHVDLYEVSLQESIDVEIPLVFVGEAEGVKMGGVLSPLIRTLEISCLPSQIPEHLEVDCSSLKIGETLHVSDLDLPEGVRVRTDPTTAIITISAPEEEEVPSVEIAEEEEVAAGTDEEEPEA